MQASAVEAHACKMKSTAALLASATHSAAVAEAAAPSRSRAAKCFDMTVVVAMPRALKT